MPPLNEVSLTRSPDECLRLALAADDDSRGALALEGLSHREYEALDPDIEALLLRQLYLAHLASRRLRQAADVALEAAALGPLADVLRHDASRALFGLGEVEAAIAQQRLATRAAPPDRRSFHWWSLGTLLHFHGDPAGATAALRRGMRWAHDDRPLLEAHAAWIALSTDEAVEDLAGIVSDLKHSPASGGYGQLVLGMIAYLIGDRAQAAVHLRAFLRRNAGADWSKTLTLREELRCARTVLAEIESV